MKKSIKYNVLNFIAILALISVIFSSLHFVPFGNKCLLISDMGSQYIPFLTNLRHALFTGDFSFYSFKLSLGDNYFILFTYYLLSPFNLLVLLFKSSQIPVAVNIILMLKIACMGWSMGFYLSKVYKNLNYSNLLFSISYALCGFIAMFYINIMWLDDIILLPIVMLGIYNLIHRNNSVFYIIVLSLTIIINYYLGYMTCIFSVIYFIYELFKTNGSYLEKKSRFLKFIKGSIVAGMISSVILIPTLMGMMRTGKGAIKIFNFMPIPTFGLDIFTQLGISGNNVLQNVNSLPILFVSSFILILLVLYFYSTKINKRTKRLSAIILLILLFSMVIMTTDTIWHMFQPPEGFLYRNAYFVIFFVIILAYESWLNKTFSDQKLLLRSGLIVSCLVSIGYFFSVLIDPFIRKFIKAYSFSYVNVNFLFYSVIFIVLITFSMCQLRDRYKTGVIVLLCLTSLELVFNFNSVNKPGPFGNYNTYRKFFHKENSLVNNVRNKDNFSRIFNDSLVINHAYSVPYNNYNDAMLFNYNGLGGYSSSLNDKSRITLNKLGFYSKNQRRISYEGATQMTKALLGVHYEIDRHRIIAHPYNLGLGSLSKGDLSKIKLTSNVFQNQNMIWKTISGLPGNFYKKSKILNVKIRPMLNSKHHRFYRYNLTVKPGDNGILYGYIPNNSVSRLHLNVNGVFKRAQHKNIISAYIFSLGDNIKNKPCKIFFNSKSRFRDLEEHFVSLNHKLFKRALKITNSNSLKIRKRNYDNNIHGYVNASSKKWLFLNIPFDRGWEIKIDNHTHSAKRVLGSFMGLKISKGHHVIDMHYRVPGLKVGFIMNVLGLVLLALIGFNENKKHNH